MKLTDTQRNVLAAGAAVAVNGEFMARFIADHWDKEWEARSIAGTLRGLVGLGLVERRGRGKWSWFAVTDAGRLALQGAEHDQ